MTNHCISEVHILIVYLHTSYYHNILHQIFRQTDIIIVSNLSQDKNPGPSTSWVRQHVLHVYQLRTCHAHLTPWGCTFAAGWSCQLKLGVANEGTVGNWYDLTFFHGSHSIRNISKSGIFIPTRVVGFKTGGSRLQPTANRPQKRGWNCPELRVHHALIEMTMEHLSSSCGAHHLMKVSSNVGHDAAKISKISKMEHYRA